MGNELKGLFGGFGGVIAAACLEGTMGRVRASASGRSAAAEIGDFAFFAGEADGDLLSGCAAAILVPQTAAWAAAIERTAPGARRFTRYAFGAAPGPEELPRLRKLVAAPPGFELRRLDGEMAALCRAEEWSRDLAPGHVGENYEGFVLLSGGELCAGAAAYARSRGGVEIEVDTRPDMRRRGLARCCAARYIAGCLERGLYPEWDAHTAVSAALAEGLGYSRRREYAAYLAAGGQDADL